MKNIKDGIYEGVGQGNSGEIRVRVEIKDQQIRSIDILDHNETKGVSDPIMEGIPKSIIKHQTYNVDAITGATITSNGIKEAVKNALEKVEGKTSVFDKEVKQEEKIENVHKQESMKFIDPNTVDWETESDVVIIGAGAAGLSAAIEAAENDASVTVIEFSANHLSSNTALCGGVYYAGDTSLQKEAGIKDSKEEWRKYIDAISGGFEDEKMMDIWVEKAADNLDWLIELGVDFPLDLMYMSGNELELAHITNPVPRGYVTKEQSGSSISDALYKRAVELNVSFHFNTIADKLITDPTGKVIGVLTNKGSFKANKGIVMATAGFSRNKEWMKSFKPDLAGGGSFGSARQQGDGIRMGMDLGANIANMWITQADTIGTQTSENMWPCMVIAIWKLPCIFVSSDGRRHMREDMYYELQSKEIAKQDGGFVWSIWDQSITDMGGQTITVPAASEGCKREVEQGYFKKADTIEELAAQIDIDPTILRETVDHYNEMMRNGEDTEWGRKTGLGEVIKAPFYAAKTVPATCDTAGGLTINQQAEVLDVWNNPIPGLYAAGSTTAGWRGEIYQGSGTAISIAVTFGRIAGENVAK